MSRFWDTPRRESPRLSPQEQARLAAWVAHLDVDLELAQRTLRLPIADLPPVPVPGELAEQPEAPKPTGRLRGAYARRAARDR